MKIFFYRYGSICEPDIIYGFKLLGFVIDECDIEMDINNKSLDIKTYIDYVYPKLMNNNYSFVFTINYYPWISKLCDILKITYISLIVDSPVLELYSDTITNSVNRIFLFDYALYDEFHKFNPKGIFHVPLYANTDRLDAFLEGIDEDTRAKYRSDISFVGSTYEEKNVYSLDNFDDYHKGFHDSLIDAQENLYGQFILDKAINKDFVKYFAKHINNIYKFPEGTRKNNEALIAQNYLAYRVTERERKTVLKRLSKEFNVDVYTRSNVSMLPDIKYHEGALTLTEMPVIFHESKINLNITSKAIRSGLPLRLFDSLGCSGFTITNYQEEIFNYFTNGYDLVVYESYDHLLELCRYYLEHEDERAEIAKNGHDKVKKYHNITIRLLEILDKAFPKKETMIS